MFLGSEPSFTSLTSTIRNGWECILFNAVEANLTAEQWQKRARFQSALWKVVFVRPNLTAMFGKLKVHLFGTTTIVSNYPRVLFGCWTSLQQLHDFPIALS